MHRASLSTRSWRIFKLGLANFWRNRLLSIAATLIMTITLLTISIFTILTLIVNITVTKVNQKIDYVIYFNETVAEDEILNLYEEAKNLSNAASVEYIDKDTAFDRWQARQTDERLKKAVTKKDNPLPRSIEIKVKDPEKMGDVATYFEDNEVTAEMIRKTSLMENQTTIDRLLNVTKFVKRTGIAFSIFFIAVSILIIFNTIRLAIFTRRDEIDIMKLVGASSSFIRWPFIFEGILYAVLATIISSTLLYLGFKFLSPVVNRYLGELMSEWGGSLLNYFNANLFWIILLQLAVGVLIGAICSAIAIRKHLKV
jgi:cell division transport system permease protein